MSSSPLPGWDRLRHGGLLLDTARLQVVALLAPPLQRHAWLACALTHALEALYVVPLAFAESHRLPRPGEKPGASAPNRFYMYGVIGRLAMLAASYELEATDPEVEVYE